IKHGWPVTHASFSPDGTRVITATGGRSGLVWDASTAEPLPTMNASTWSKHSGASPDGHVWLATGNPAARLSDLAGTRFADPAPLRPGGHVWSAAFSRRGERAVPASGDGAAAVWDTTTGRRVTALKHGRQVFHASISPADGRVLTAAGDNVARI